MLSYDDLYPEVEKAARSAARSWTGVVDVEDIAQDVWVKIFEYPALLSYGPEQRGKVLRAIARQCAGSEMADLEIFSGNSNYSTYDVRRILGSGGAGDVPGTPTHAEWIDVQAGLSVISPWYAEAIFSNYVVGDYDTTTGQARTELTRARDALTVAMNTHRKTANADYEGPGSRKAVPNASARELSKRESGDQ